MWGRPTWPPPEISSTRAMVMGIPRAFSLAMIWGLRSIRACFSTARRSSRRPLW